MNKRLHRCQQVIQSLLINTVVHIPWEIDRKLNQVLKMSASGQFLRRKQFQSAGAGARPGILDGSGAAPICIWQTFA